MELRIILETAALQKTFQNLTDEKIGILWKILEAMDRRELEKSLEILTEDIEDLKKELVEEVVGDFYRKRDAAARA